MNGIKNTSSKLRDEIENAILTGDYRPGTRLDEVGLATRFGVSRTPIREALMQLAEAGVVEIRPRRGTVVMQLAPDRLVQMFEVMAELEAMAARLAARRHTKADAEALKAAHQACTAAAGSGDPDAYYYENERFHHALYAASHQEFLIEQCLALSRRLRPYRRLQLRVRHRVASSLSEHDGIVNAILEVDGERSARLVREHVVVQGERFSDLVSSLKAADAGD